MSPAASLGALLVLALPVDWPPASTMAAHDDGIYERVKSRITVRQAAAGETSLSVHRPFAFPAGSHVRLNAGGATEEDAPVLRAPLLLAAPLNHMHGLGETVLLFPAVGAAPRPSPPPLDASQVARVAATTASAASANATTASAGWISFELDGLATLAAATGNRTTTFVDRWEAAVVFVLVLGVAACVGGYVAQVFCAYSLCCCYRGKSVLCWRRRRRPPAVHFGAVSHFGGGQFGAGFGAGAPTGDLLRFGHDFPCDDRQAAQLNSP